MVTRGLGIGLAINLLLGLELLDLIPDEGQSMFMTSQISQSYLPVLARVALLPAKELEQGVEAASEERAEDRADPVDPEVLREAGVDNSRTEGASRIERAASEVDTLL